MAGFDERPHDGSDPDTPGFRGGRSDKSKRTPDHDFVELARDAFHASTTYVESTLSNQWERNDRLFRSEHASGSKYLSPQFRFRSNIFRPKTREASRKAEAQAAAAFFSTEDVVSVSATDDKNDVSRAAAMIGREVLNHRLNSKSKNSIPWFLTCVGALQDARKNGLCFSKQWWEYSRRKTGTEIVSEPSQDAMGNVIAIEEERDTWEVICDRPRCDLIPIRNVRFDPGADWIDPIGTSPYVIIMTPMFVCDLKARIAKEDTKTTEPAWLKVTDADLNRAKTAESQRTTVKDREKDQSQRENTIRDHDLVWVHENHFRVDGEDLVWWTLGTFALLSKPVPLAEVYWHGERPIVAGRALIETHVTYPDGHIGMTHQMQREINDMVNSRADAVAFATTPIAKVKRGAQVDIAALTHRYAGRTVSMKDPATDVVWDRAPQPTSMGFQEEDRLAVSMDGINGTFSPSSINSNRQLNETVGGMELLDANAGTIGEYDLRVFAETWAEPVLTQLLKLEQKYETDETVLTLAAEAADAWQMLQIDNPEDQSAEMVAELLNEELIVKVNVGVGATDPQRQIQKFMFGINSLFGVAAPLIERFGPQVTESPGFKAISEEIFGKLGYRDGARFLDFAPPKGAGPEGPSPEVMAAQQENQMLQQALGEAQQKEQSKAVEIQGKMALQNMATQGKMLEKEADHRFKIQQDMTKAQMDMMMSRAMGGAVVNVV